MMFCMGVVILEMRCKQMIWVLKVVLTTILVPNEKHALNSLCPLHCFYYLQTIKLLLYGCLGGKNNNSLQMEQHSGRHTYCNHTIDTQMQESTAMFSHSCVEALSVISLIRSNFICCVEIHVVEFDQFTS